MRRMPDLALFQKELYLRFEEGDIGLNCRSNVAIFRQACLKLRHLLMSASGDSIIDNQGELKVCKNEELKRSEPKSSPQNQNGR